jgi:transposase
LPVTAFELPGLVISQIFNSNKGLVILAQTNQSGAVCPNCQSLSERVHSYYSRQAQDLPLSDKCVELKLRVRRFRCLNSQCPQKIFAERLTLLVPHAQRSSRLKQALKTLAINLSAEVAATLVPLLHLGRISPDTLLRMVKQSLATSTDSSTIIGVDDFAFRRGQRYGTIIVDLVQHKPIDLLPDRSAATLSRWLKSNPQVELVTRDRSTEYARAITQGAPNALQVADRWHIIKNWKEVLERVFQRLYAPQMQRLKASGRLAVKKAGQRATSSSSSSQKAAAKAARERRIARYDAIKELEARDCNISEIAQQLQMSRTTVRKYLSMPNPPVAPEKRRVRQISEPYLSHLQNRWVQGCHNASQLWRELVKLGFSGTYKPVKSWASLQRDVPGRKLSRREEARLRERGEPEPLEAVQLTGISQKDLPLSLASTENEENQHQLEALPTPRNLVWLYLKRPEELNKMEQQWLAFLSEDAQLETLEELNQQFLEMIRERKSVRLDEWLEKCEQSPLVELQTFSEGLQREFGAIKNGLSLKWSNGPVEGEVNRLKLIKRTMYGRGSFELLKQKVLQAA